MADTITITPGAETAVTVTPIPGSVKAGGGHDDRGGGRIPKARAGYARNGSCDVVLDSATGTTVAAALALASGVGSGNRKIIGADRYANIESYDALIDVEISGDSVQVAKISWKGSYNPVVPEP